MQTSRAEGGTSFRRWHMGGGGWTEGAVKWNFYCLEKKERKKERTKERKEKREREEGANRSKGNNDGAREHPLSTVRIPGIGNWLDVCSFQRGHNWLHLYANREGLKVGSSRAFRGKPPINGRGEISVRFGKPGFEIGLELGSRTRAL